MKIAIRSQVLEVKESETFKALLKLLGIEYAEEVIENVCQGCGYENCVCSADIEER